MDETASEARPALLATCSSVEASNFWSNLMRIYPPATMTVRPANTRVRPSFQPNAMATTLVAMILTITFSISPRFADINSCTEEGAEDNFAVNAPDEFSGRSKKSWSKWMIRSTISRR
jgi:hypothetical protein